MLFLLLGIWFNRGSEREPAGPRPSDSTLTESNDPQGSDVADSDASMSESIEAEIRVSDASGDSAALEKSAGSLSVCIDGLRSEGAILVALFAQQDGFPDKQRASRTLSAPVAKATAKLRIDDLQMGTYAIAVFQDLNADGVLNKGAFGVPSEPYGFSNNVRGRIGPPSFQAASFELDDMDRQVDITLK